LLGTQVTQLLLLKLLLLPALMVGLTLLCGMRNEYGLGLVLLAACPLAQLAFLMCHQYHTGEHLA
jgi:predicted permease